MIPTCSTLLMAVCYRFSFDRQRLTPACSTHSTLFHTFTPFYTELYNSSFPPSMNEYNTLTLKASFTVTLLCLGIITFRGRRYCVSSPSILRIVCLQHHHCSSTTVSSSIGSDCCIDDSASSWFVAMITSI